MSIEYKDVKEFEPQQLQDLFLSVEWSSGHYPERLAQAMKNYGSVFTAWSDDQKTSLNGTKKLVGLISSMDDGCMTAYVHYLLVHPDYQGGGIGRELVNMTRKHYADYLRVLLVAYENETPFYEHCGFTAHKDKVPMMITSLWT